MTSALMGQKLGCQLAQYTFSLASAHQLSSHPMNSFYIFKRGVHWKWRTGSILLGRRKKKKKKKSHKQCIRLFLRKKNPPMFSFTTTPIKWIWTRLIKQHFLDKLPQTVDIKCFSTSASTKLSHTCTHAFYVSMSGIRKILLITLYFKFYYWL